jgi:hypothetical protein
MIDTPEFNAIWETIKRWDINVPDAYGGYCGATGNHVRAILDAITPALRQTRLDALEEAAKEAEGFDDPFDEHDRGDGLFIARAIRALKDKT